MIDRRSFLGRRRSPALPRAARLGVQLYTVRDRMAQDFEGTLKAVADIGYAEVEFAGLFGNRVPRVRSLLDELGLTSPAAHVQYDDVIDPTTAVFDEAAELGNTYAVVAYLDESLRSSADDYRKIADHFNDAGVRARAAGVRFAYHNHAFEFDVLGGRRGLDILLESTDPTLVAFELDLFWTAVGGGDAIQLFERHPGRFPLVHVKDRDAHGKMVDVGAGQLDFAAVFAKAELAGIQHAFVEHDEPGDSLASIAASYRYLERLTGAPAGDA